MGVCGGNENARFLKVCHDGEMGPRGRENGGGRGEFRIERGLSVNLLFSECWRMDSRRFILSSFWAGLFLPIFLWRAFPELLLPFIFPAFSVFFFKKPQLGYQKWFQGLDFKINPQKWKNALKPLQGWGGPLEKKSPFSLYNPPFLKFGSIGGRGVRALNPSERIRCKSAKF